MRTRLGLSYSFSGSESPPKEAEERVDDGGKRNRGREKYETRKRPRTASPAAEEELTLEDLFDLLPDEIIVVILSKMGSSASSPSDLINGLITCKRMNELGMSPLVLLKLSAKALAIRAKNWSESAHKFLKQCADAGNFEACYILGMICFYCLERRSSGASLMVQAAYGSHMAAIYALAVIRFNGSGSRKHHKDLTAAFALCARAATLGYIDALRELGYCVQDGYGVPKNVAEGRRLLLQANVKEVDAVLPSTIKAAWKAHRRRHIPGKDCGCSLLREFCYNVPVRAAHPANQFMVEWFAMRGGPSGEGLKMCSYGRCGRPETQEHEFRRCSGCHTAQYCSRACQALHWKLVHKAECTPRNRRLDAGGGGGGVGGGAPPLNGGVGLVNY